MVNEDGAGTRAGTRSRDEGGNEGGNEVEVDERRETRSRNDGGGEASLASRALALEHAVIARKTQLRAGPVFVRVWRWFDFARGLTRDFSSAHPPSSTMRPSSPRSLPRQNSVPMSCILV